MFVIIIDFTYVIVLTCVFQNIIVCFIDEILCNINEYNEILRVIAFVFKFYNNNVCFGVIIIYYRVFIGKFISIEDGWPKKLYYVSHIYLWVTPYSYHHLFLLK